MRYNTNARHFTGNSNLEIERLAKPKENNVCFRKVVLRQFQNIFAFLRS